MCKKTCLNAVTAVCVLPCLPVVTTALDLRHWQEYKKRPQQAQDDTADHESIFYTKLLFSGMDGHHPIRICFEFTPAKSTAKECVHLCKSCHSAIFVVALPTCASTDAGVTKRGGSVLLQSRRRSSPAEGDPKRTVACPSMMPQLMNGHFFENAHNALQTQKGFALFKRGLARSCPLVYKSRDPFGCALSEVMIMSALSLVTL